MNSVHKDMPGPEVFNDELYVKEELIQIDFTLVDRIEWRKIPWN